MSGTLKALAGSLAATALAWLALENAPPAHAAEKQRAFTLSTDPQEIVLQARFSSDTRPSVVYTLYGDGRLVHERLQEAAKHVSEHVEVQLGFLDREELVQIVVDAGLLECDPDCIEKRCAQSLGLQRIARARDCGGVLLTLNLESYRGPGESTPSPVQRRLYQHCPHDVAELCPGIQELQSLRDLGRALHEHKQAAQDTVQ